MVTVLVLQQHALTMVAERPQTIMISTEAVSVLQLPQKTMVVEQPQHITTHTVIVSDQVTTGKKKMDISSLFHKDMFEPIGNGVYAAATKEAQIPPLLRLKTIQRKKSRADYRI